MDSDQIARGPPAVLHRRNAACAVSYSRRASRLSLVCCFCLHYVSCFRRVADHPQLSLMSVWALFRFLQICPGHEIHPSTLGAAGRLHVITCAPRPRSPSVEVLHTIITAGGIPSPVVNVGMASPFMVPATASSSAMSPRNILMAQTTTSNLPLRKKGGG
ncbi:hypothetical protein B0T25DRAFT_322917 [Lasiosphaeria hispida]|uniref:Uncharacterized protein n=1 Tax=Lasiosphaeria hispida TaxID=260671 RepID=A0AAJ0M9S2_9PEZI|nr:hypothetical protein B0T25DRAFT_322917 [Lasiosphaeria hispida]